MYIVYIKKGLDFYEKYLKVFCYSFFFFFLIYWHLTSFFFYLSKILIILKALNVFKNWIISFLYWIKTILFLNLYFCVFMFYKISKNIIAFKLSLPLTQKFEILLYMWLKIIMHDSFTITEWNYLKISLLVSVNNYL